MIAEAAAKIEKHFGHPLDLEWALDHDGVLWWLQARPITHLVSPPSFVIQCGFEGADDSPVTVWSNWNVRETMPDPLYPLAWTFWRDEVIPKVAPLVSGVSPSSPVMPDICGLDLVHGRVYFNMNVWVGLPLIGPMMLKLLPFVDATAGKTLCHLYATGVLRPRPLPCGKFRLFGIALKGIFLNALRDTHGLFPRRAMRVLRQDSAPFRRRDDLPSLSNAELTEELRLFRPEKGRRLFYGIHMMIGAGISYWLAYLMFRKFPEVQQVLTTGIPANPTTQISIAIDELTTSARPLKAVFLEPSNVPELLEKLGSAPGGEAWLGRFRAFLDEFGHRGPKEFDLGGVRWYEAPEMIIGLIREGLKTPAEKGFRARLRHLSAERKQRIAEALKASPRWQRPLMRVCARMVESYMPLREAPKHYAMKIFLRIRLAALELGRRFAEEGLISTHQDVFFLEWSELLELARGQRPDTDWHSLIRERQELYKRFQAEEAPEFLRSDGVPVALADEKAVGFQNGTLRGTPVSGGIATGRVSVLTSPDPGAMAHGDVIVLRYADPGWTPLFPRAAAVVMEVGGLMCHAAVVAREMGIPAVFGVPGATRLLETGQVVTVDGNQGVIKKVF